MKLPPAIRDRIEHEITISAAAAEGHIDHEAASNGGIALFGTIGEVWLLRPDGSLWRVDSDYGLPLEALPADLATVAVVAGAKRYPWLHELLPPRPPSAVVCPECAGRGKIGPEDAYFCHRCSALGWTM